MDKTSLEHTGSWNEFSPGKISGKQSENNIGSPEQQSGNKEWASVKQPENNEMSGDNSKKNTATLEQKSEKKSEADKDNSGLESSENKLKPQDTDNSGLKEDSENKPNPEDKDKEGDTNYLVMKVTGFTKIKRMKRATSEWRQIYGPQPIREHHLVPQVMLKDPKFVQRLKQLGIKNPKAFVDRKIAQLPNVKHVEIHRKRGNKDWNTDFAKWFKDYPDFSLKDLEKGIKI